MQRMDSVFGMDVLMTAHSLYHSTLQGDWKDALTAYQNDASIHTTPINSCGDTALHVAVNDGKEDIVAKLVDEIKTIGSLTALEKENNRGDTPLHCAASRGCPRMCACIAEAHGGNKLLQARNRTGETPLFLAALHGHKHAFLYLNSLCSGDHSSLLWKRTSDGETVLHCTIHRELFELAFEIILLYKTEIVGSVDEKGITPLHILASKPSAFETSSNFRWYNKLVYNCIMVEPLKTPEQRSKNDNTWRSRTTGADAENPSYDEYENAPPNYRTCYDVFVGAFTCFIQLVAEALGIQDLKHLREKKQKHVWCRQILNQLWERRNIAYVGGGSALQGYLLPSVREEKFPKPGQIDHEQGDDPKKTVEDKIGDGNQSQQKGDGEKKKCDRKESALFIAANNGVLEKLEKILKDKPGAIQKPNGDGNQSQQKGDGEKKDRNSKESSALFIADKNGALEILEKILKDKPGTIQEPNQKGDREKREEWDSKESALFIAAKNGVLEILKKILKDKPGAIHENNSKGQNVLHVAVKYRQPHVFELLMKERLWDNLVQGVDDDSNTVLHLAAKLSHYKPWHIPGSALQMQWEIKWFLYIRDVTPKYLPFLYNKDQETPVEIFRRDHEGLVKDGTEWLKSTSESCSVVAALIAGVAFATSTTIPGGTQEETGKPYLERHPAFNMFAFTSLLALCSSITSLVMFLAILTSRHQPRDFHKDLPLKLLMGLSSLFVSIASILVSFSAAFFFVLKDNLKQAVFPLYAAAILPLTFYGVAQFPLYADLVRAIFFTVPQSSNRESEKFIL